MKLISRNDLYCLNYKTVKNYITIFRLLSPVRSFFFSHWQHTKMMSNTPLNKVDIMAETSKTERAIAVFSFFAELKHKCI